MDVDCRAGKSEANALGMEELTLQAEPFAKPLVKAKIPMLCIHHDRVSRLGKVQPDLVEPAG